MKLANYILFTVIFYSCAVIEAPSGGQKDTTPPNIANQTPNNYTKNYQKKEVQIEFSKFMNRNSVKDAIRINPPVQYEINWFRRNLTIKFLEELKSNTTYSIQIGALYSDIKGNKPERSNSIVFSTGDQIDSLRVSGNVIAQDPAGMLIYAWREDNYDLDTLDITRVEPDYITELGKSGEFSLEALKPGKYRVIGFFDKNFDLFYSDGFEEFAMPTTDIYASDSSFIYSMYRSKAKDNNAPELISLQAKSRSFLELKYSEPVLFDKESFLISDSNSIFKHQIDSFYYLDSIPGKKIGLITDPLDTSLAYKFYGSVKDTLDQKILDSMMTRVFRVTDLKFEPTYLLPDVTDSTNLKSYNELILKFDIPPKNFFDENIKLILNDNYLDAKFEKLNENNYKIKIDSLILDSLYTLQINLNNIETVTGDKFIDSTFNLRFFPPKPKEYNSISGRFVPKKDFCDGDAFIRLYSKNNVYQTKVNNDSTWKIDNIIPDNYQSEIFCDLNNNGKWDAGDPINYILAEKIYQHPEIIEIKARWDLEQIIIKQ